MKYILLSLLIILPLLGHTISDQFRIVSPVEPKTGFGPFYPVTGKFLELQVTRLDILPELTIAKTNEYFHVIKAEQLAAFNIKKGDQLSYIKFETGEVKTVTIPEKINVLLKPVENYNSRYSKIYIQSIEINLEDFDNKKYEEPKEFKLNGLAYIGKDYKFKKNGATPISYVPVQEEKQKSESIDIFMKSFETLTKNKYNLQSTNLRKFKNFNFIDISLMPKKKSNEELGKSGLIIDDSNKNIYQLNSDWDDGQYGSSYGEFYIGNAIEDTDFIMVQFEGTMHECAQVVIMKNKKVEKYKLYCDTGGC